MIKDLLTNKSGSKKAQIKAREICKVNFKEGNRHKKDTIEIEIVDGPFEISVGENNGIEIFARAWKDGKQLGFGKDGSVEIERFRIFNPPILVADPNGTIIKEWADEKTGNLKQLRLREDLKEAVIQSLSHTIQNVGKDGSKITFGKIGNTTSTFYSNTGGDGSIRNFGTVASGYAAVHDAGAGVSVDQAAEINTYNARDASNYYIRRGFFPFDTSAIDNGDTIDSATFSLYITVKVDLDNEGVRITAETQADNTSLATGDFDALSFTAIADDVDMGSITTSAYNDFPLTNLKNVSKTGYTPIACITKNDGDSVAPTSQKYYAGIQYYSADRDGTTQDPKLVVVHSVASTAYTYSTSQVVSMADSNALSSTFNISKTETTTMTEVASVLKGFFETLTENFTITDTTDTFNGILLTISDTFSLSDLTVAQKDLTVSIIDTIINSDSTSNLLTQTITVEEAIALRDSLIKAGWSWQSKYGSGSDWTYQNKAE